MPPSGQNWHQERQKPPMQSNIKQLLMIRYFYGYKNKYDGLQISEHCFSDCTDKEFISLFAEDTDSAAQSTLLS